MRVNHAVLVAAALVAACSQQGAAPEAVEEYWQLPAVELPDGTPIEGLQYINATSIQEFDGARTAFIVAFGRGLMNPDRAGTRMDIVNSYDCANRRMRTVSLTIRIDSSPPSTTRADEAWRLADETPSMEAVFDFVCGTPASRIADRRFTRITDTRPIQVIADESIAALETTD